MVTENDASDQPAQERTCKGRECRAGTMDTWVPLSQLIIRITLG